MIMPLHRAVKIITTVVSRCLRASVLLLACSPALAADCSSILLNAFDNNFKIQRDLRTEDIRVEIDRKQAQILSLSLDTHPRRIVLLVDSSGSMEASPQRSGWGITLPAAAYAVDVLPASASAALVTFSEKLRIESNAFENRHLVGARVLDLAKRQQPRGPTSLFDSIDQVLAEFKELQLGDAIYVVTDGGDNKSRIPIPKLQEELISRGVRVFAFLVMRAGSRSEEEISGASQIDSLAGFTGGDVVPISSTEISGNGRADLDKLAPRIVGQVEEVYRLELLSGVERPARVKLAFVDRDRKRNTRNIAYSHQIVPCPVNKKLY